MAADKYYEGNQDQYVLKVLKLCLLIYLWCICVQLCGHTQAVVYTCRSEDILQKLVLSFYLVCPGD